MLPGKNTSVTHVTEHIVTHVTCFDSFFIPKILAEISECTVFDVITEHALISGHPPFS